MNWNRKHAVPIWPSWVVRPHFVDNVILLNGISCVSVINVKKLSYGSMIWTSFLLCIQKACKRFDTYLSMKLLILYAHGKNKKGFVNTYLLFSTGFFRLLKGRSAQDPTELLEFENKLSRISWRSIESLHLVDAIKIAIDSR